MPWKATCVIDERTSMISEYLSGDYSIAELARRRGISRKTAHKWIGRYLADGGGGLGDRSRAPRHHPHALSEAMEGMILAWKARRPGWGAPKIHSKLWSQPDCPAESTVSNVLRRHGLSRRQRRRLPAPPYAGPLVTAGKANEVWCVDFKGWFRLGNGRRCDPLTLSDAWSRYLLCCQGICGPTGWLTVRPLLVEVFREYGLPQRIRSDNGAPFASSGLGGLSPLAVWWLQLGIGLERIQPGHPEQNGRHERIHRTLKETVSIRTTLRRQQAAFDDFRRDYNEERPHEALGQQPPASVYAPSVRAYPERLPRAEYPTAWVKRSVRSNGEIKWNGELVYVSQSLAGHWVGLEPVAEELWRIYFMHHPLAWLDEHKTVPHLRPLKMCNLCP